MVRIAENSDVLISDGINFPLSVTVLFRGCSTTVFVPRWVKRISICAGTRYAARVAVWKVTRQMYGVSSLISSPSGGV